MIEIKQVTLGFTQLIRISISYICMIHAVGNLFPKVLEAQVIMGGPNVVAVDLGVADLSVTDLSVTVVPVVVVKA